MAEAAGGMQNSYKEVQEGKGDGQDKGQNRQGVTS